MAEKSSNLDKAVCGICPTCTADSVFMLPFKLLPDFCLCLGLLLDT